MPYFPILQKPTQNNLITKTSFRQDASSPRRKTAEERLPPLSDCANGAARCTAMGKTAEERLYKRHPGMRQRRITPRNPIRTTRQRRAHGASAGTISMRFGDALPPPLGAAHPHRKNRHPSVRLPRGCSKKRPMVGIPTIGLCIATFCCAITC